MFELRVGAAPRANGSAINDISALLDALAWPCVALIALFLFREEIKLLAARVKTATLPGGASMSFSDLLNETKAASFDAVEAANEPPTEGTVMPDIAENLVFINAGSPSGTVQSAYSRILETVREILREKGRFVPKPYQIEESLLKHWLPEQEREVFAKLRDAQRSAFMGVRSPDLSEAFEYQALVSSFLSRVEPILREQL